VKLVQNPAVDAGEILFSVEILLINGKVYNSAAFMNITLQGTGLSIPMKGEYKTYEKEGCFCMRP
jgi:hypothetical protein